MATPLIIAALIIGAIWAVYLLPTLFGERNPRAPLNSTEEFDRWTHSMAHVQKHTAAALAASHKAQVRNRRRRTLILLVVLAFTGFAAAAYFSSMPWLLAGLFFTCLIALYVAILAQIKQNRLQQLKVSHVAERPSEWDEPQIRVIAN